jgi:iron(III) transport system ATP-binding protein
VRLHLRGEIKDLQERLGVTTIMVTHDQEEALTMADRILVMDRGRIVQEGAPRQVYDHPATPFVAAFIGSMNFLPGAVKRGDGAFELAGRVLGAAREPLPLAEGAPALLAIRPEHVVLAREDEAAVRLQTQFRPQFRAGVRSVEFRGASTRVSLALTGFGDQGAVEADLPASRAAELGLSRGQMLGLSFPAERLSAFHPA